MAKIKEISETREYFWKIGFVKAVEKLENFMEIPAAVKSFAESLKPRIEELKDQFNNYRNRTIIKHGKKFDK